MKYLINFSILFIGLTVPGQINAQVIETFYNLSWKPCEPSNAAYYSTVQKTDSGWLRNDYYTGTKTLQMQALFSDKECTISNGSYKYFHANGRASALGKSLNDKKEGVCVGYHTNGLMKDSAFYQKGEIVDKKFFWHPNGYMSDSISRMNDSVFVHVGWHDDGAIAFAGRMLYGKENGIWKYYHRNGQEAATEKYNKGKVISKEYFNEDGSPQPDTSKANREASFKGGMERWIKYLGRSLNWPSGVQLDRTGSVVVVLGFTITEEGKIEDVEVLIPFHPEFDKIAVEAVRASPAWQPAISHNCKIKAYRKQPVTFTQPDD